MQPLLSLAMTGRNDGYMGDFNWRIATALNVNARSAATIGRLADLEMLVVDWNSETPLREVLDLVPEARQATRFIEVPSTVAARWDIPFPDSVTTNIGLRRCAGTYVAYSAADVAIPASGMNALFNVLDGRTVRFDPAKVFWLVGRRHLDVNVVRHQPPVDQLEAMLASGFRTYEEQGLSLNSRGQSGTGAPANVMLAHRDIWAECRGFDERYVYTSFNDINLAIRVTQKYPLMHLDNYGCFSYHLEHFTAPRDYANIGGQLPGKRLNRVDELMPEFTGENAEAWGLENVEIPIRAA